MNTKRKEDRRTLTRRTLLAGLAGVLPAAAGLSAAAAAVPGEEKQRAVRGRIKQSLSRWCYRIPLEKLAETAADMGYRGIDLVGPKEWPVVKRYGLVPTMAPGAGTIRKAWNRKEHHERLAAEMKKNLAAAAEAGVPNVITFSGNREGLPDDEGLENCAAGLKQVVGFAEEKGITICMELLNSKVDHKDYQCDHTAWGAALVEKVGSPRFKLLYDIYHMQIMEGDLIRTIRANIEHIGHFHTGGNPGRNEIDETQEIYYPAVMRAVADLGFQGYVAHEFVPRNDPVASMRKAFAICDV